MKLLILETTCDETAAAVVAEDRQVLSSIVASQDELHQRFGGVVPEIASRAHVERMVPVIDEALRRAQVQPAELAAVAVATAPGLAGSLLVGLAAAKSLCVAWGKPLIAINHLHAHIYACQFASPTSIFPCVGLVASGGHSNLYRCTTPLQYELLGATIDDAAGEAFDKVANLLGLPYPGGPAIQRVAQQGRRDAFRFPRSFLKEPERLQFSFSGLKTAVRYQVSPPGAPERSSQALSERDVADLAASFQEAVVDVLVGKSVQALHTTALDTLCVGGGVAANARFRERLEDASRREGFRLYVAPPQLCTDNAVMGAIAIERLRAGLIESLAIDIQPGPLRSN